jgi:uncharacterized protein (TIGR03435 family)
MELIRTPVAALFFGALLFAQDAAQTRFEVASVKPSPPDAPDQVKIGVHLDGARFSADYLSLLDYIRIAYDTKLYRISAPEWVATARYDISASVPPGVKRDQFPEMLRALLEERFHLRVHHESREFPVYGLVLAKGATLKESPAEDTPASAPLNVTGGGSERGVSIVLGPGSYFSFADNKLDAKKVNLTWFSDTLSRFLDKPVVNMTGLNGTYDIHADLTPEDYRSMLIQSAVNSGVTLPPQVLRSVEPVSGSAVSSELQAAGLKLESRKAPLDVIVVDHVDKNPTEN